ncbi:MAG: hypothetical protein QOI48_1998 [Solirubrobacteraceae bacterium]|nr:hypothetical protein [Solirubrobacteraceae bacterium]
MHEPTRLVLGHLDVRHAHQLVHALLRDAEQAGEPARQVDRRATPHLAEQVVPGHRPLVIEAVRAQRFTQTWLVGRVPHRARQRDAVRADRRIPARPAPLRTTLAVRQMDMHRPEARRRQRRERRRMPRHRLGHALAASKPSGDQLPRIAAIALRARPADRLTPIAARLPKQLVRLTIRRPHPPPATVPVANLDLPAQPHRPCAVARRA